MKIKLKCQVVTLNEFSSKVTFINEVKKNDKGQVIADIVIELSMSDGNTIIGFEPGKEYLVAFENA
jgi:hypothetical protein